MPDELAFVFRASGRHRGVTLLIIALSSSPVQSSKTPTGIENSRIVDKLLYSRTVQ